MTKTPEQMAEEFADDWHKDCDYPEAILKHTKRATATVFLAGYKAAKDELQPQPFHAGADVYIIDANNPLPKPMPLSIAEQDQLADGDKVMGELSRAFDQGYQSAKAHYQTDWISVKERLPEDGQDVLVCVNGQVLISYVHGMKGFSSKWGLAENGETIWPTHWMPLPEAPKGEG